MGRVQVLSAQLGPGPSMRGRELGSCRVFPFPSFKTLFLLLHLGALSFVVEYEDKPAFSVGISISRIFCLTPRKCPLILRAKEYSSFVPEGNLLHQWMAFPLVAEHR